LLKALPEKPALSRVGSESDNLGGSRRQRSIAEGYGYGFNGGGGFAIGASRGDGSVGGGEAEPDAIRSGLASPSTSVSSSAGSAVGYEAFMAQHTGISARSGGGVEEGY
jgi:hypothetical protein